jgi:hypothetical protein
MSFLLSVTNTLNWTNTLANYGIRKVFIVHAGVLDENISLSPKNHILDYFSLASVANVIKQITR